LRTLARYLALLVCWLPLLNSPLAIAVEVHPGDILVGVADFTVGHKGDFAVVRVNPISGDTTVISSNSVGSGPSAFYYNALAAGADGKIYAAGESASGGVVLQIDPTTGNRTLISDSTRGGGMPMLEAPATMTSLPDGSLLLWGYNQNSPPTYIRVDPTTGDRFALPAPSYDFPNPTMPLGLSPFGDDAVLIADAMGSASGSSVYRLDLNTGSHPVISGNQLFPNPDVGTGPEIQFAPHGQALDPAQNFLYIIQSANVLRVDTATGNRELVSSWTSPTLLGDGPQLFTSYGLAFGLDGNLVTLYDKLYRINTTTGDRSIIADLDLDGYDLSGGAFVVVPHPVPEPGVLALASIGILAAVLMRKRFGNARL
jgi:hypothetical protein